MKRINLSRLEMSMNNRFVHSENVSEVDLIEALGEDLDIRGIKTGVIGSIQVREFEVIISATKKGFSFSVRKLPFQVIAETQDGYILISRFENLTDALNYCIDTTDELEPFDGSDLSHNNHIRYMVFDKDVYIDRDSCDPVIPKPVYETGMYYI